MDFAKFSTSDADVTLGLAIRNPKQKGIEIYMTNMDEEDAVADNLMWTILDHGEVVMMVRLLTFNIYNLCMMRQEYKPFVIEDLVPFGNSIINITDCEKCYGNFVGVDATAIVEDHQGDDFNVFDVLFTKTGESHAIAVITPKKKDKEYLRNEMLDMLTVNIEESTLEPMDYDIDIIRHNTIKLMVFRGDVDGMVSTYKSNGKEFSMSISYEGKEIATVKTGQEAFLGDIDASLDLDRDGFEFEENGLPLYAQFQHFIIKDQVNWVVLEVHGDDDIYAKICTKFDNVVFTIKEIPDEFCLDDILDFVSLVFDVPVQLN